VSAVALLTPEELQALVSAAVETAFDARVESEILTLDQAAEFLSLHPKVVVRYIAERKLPAARLGRQYRFIKRDLAIWLKTQAVK